MCGFSDMELQEELLKKTNLNIEEAEKLSVAKESSKFSQAAMSGDSMAALKSSYKKNKMD